MVKSRKVKNIFQSTPSVGRATLDDIATMRDIIISIHALRGEGDYSHRPQAPHTKKFQSTPSVGRATLFRQILLFYAVISIHALRGEGDHH